MKTQKDSELRYRRLFEAAQDGILILDAKTGMIEDVNPYLIKMLGYSREEFIKKKLWDVGAFKDVKASQDAFVVLQNNEYVRYENLPLKAKDGRLIQVEFVSNVYLVRDEKVIQCNIRDITEHKRILVALQENEKKYHDLVNQSPEGVFIIEPSGSILTINKAMCKELQYSEEECHSMSIWELIPEQYLDQYRTSLSMILEGLSLLGALEYAVQGKDGKIHWVEILPAPYYSGKELIGFQGIARDITQRKQAEQALRLSENTMYAWLNAIQESLLLIDREGLVLTANATVAQRLHISVEDLVGACIYDFFPQEVTHSRRLHIAQVIETGQPVRFEDERSGRVIDNTVYPVFDQTGQVKYLALLGTDITERRQAEETIRQSEERFRSIFEHTAIGNSLTLPDGRMMKINKALADMLGYTVEEMQNLNFARFTFPEDIAESLESIRKLLANECDVYRTEKRYFHKNGKIIWADVSSSLLRDANGTPLHLISNFVDITEKKEAQAQILHMASFPNVNRNPVLELDASGSVKYTNPAVTATLERLQYGPDAGAFIPADIDFILSKLAQGEDATYFREITFGSSIFHEDIFLLPQYQVVRIYAFDITAQKQTEEALRRSQLLLNETQHITKVGGWEFDPFINKVTWTDEVYKIYGLSKEYNPSRPEQDIQFYFPEDQEKISDAFKQAVEKGEPYKLELQMITAQGEKIWVRTMGQVERQEGKIMRVFGNIHDITEHKHAQEKILQLNNELEQRVLERTAQLEAANKELESFSYSVSHDLRAPLRAINGFSEIIARRYRSSLNEEAQHYFDNIIEASKRMEQLIDDLLQYSRLGRKGVHHDLVLLADIFTDLATDLKERLSQNQGTLTIASNLPTLMSDRTLLTQIFLNLLDNALTYHVRGQPVEISVTWQKNDKSYIFHVRDNGIGIPLEYQEKIFNVFQRLHGQEEYPGTGIGLATVKKSVQLLDGSVSVESQVGKGSTFSVYLPKE